jgi:hypothetical protein
MTWCEDTAAAIPGRDRIGADRGENAFGRAGKGEYLVPGIGYALITPVAPSGGRARAS